MADIFSGLLTGGGGNGGGDLGSRLKNLETNRAAEGAAFERNKKKKKSQEWLEQNKNAEPVKVAGTFGIPAIDAVSDAVTGVAKDIGTKLVRGEAAARVTRDNIIQGKPAFEGVNKRQFLADTLETGLNFAPIGAGAKALSGATKVKTAAKIGAGYGAAQGTTESIREKSSPLDTVKNIASYTAAGAGVGVGTAALGQIFKVGADKALSGIKDRKEAKRLGQEYFNSITGTDTKLLSAGDAPLALPAGKVTKTNSSQAAIKGTPATPETLPVDEKEYAKRFAELSKSYEKQVKALEKEPPLVQRMKADRIDEEHASLLEKLDNEFEGGKPNPDFKPATADKTVETGFVMTDTAKPLKVAKEPTKQVQQRIDQIEDIVQAAHEKGTHRSPEQLRALLKERRDGLDIIEGKKTFDEVYGGKPVSKLGGARPQNGAQLEFEEAVNSGDRATAQRVVDTISDPELKAPLQSVLDDSLPVDGTKTRGFIDTVKESPKTNPAIADKIDGSYSPLSNKETLKKADDAIAKDFEGELRVARTSDDFNTETQAKAVRMIDYLQQQGRFEDAIDVVEKTAERATKGGQGTQILAAYNRLTPEGILSAAQREVTKAQKQNPEKYKSLRVTEEQAQTLRTMAENVQKMTPGEEKIRATRDLVNEIGRTVPTNNTQKFVSLWKAGLLTGIKGAVFGNQIGNNSRLLLNQLSNAPATAIDAIIAKATGQRSRTFTLKGIASGFKEGVGVGVRDFKKGGVSEKEAAGAANKLDYRKVYFSRSPLGKAAQKYTDSVFNFYSSSDRPVFYSQLRTSLQDLAKTEAKNQGLKGKAAQRFVDKTVVSPPDNLLKQAHDEAEKAVFQDKNALGAGLSGLKGRMRGTKLEAPSEVILPFTGVPSSIASAVYDYTPVSGAVRALKAIKQVSKGEFDQAAQRKLTGALGTSITGTGLMWLGSELSKTGQMTGSYPTDEAERARWEQDGKTPYSVLVGGSWRSLNYLGPISAVMAIGGEIEKARREGLGLGEGAASAALGAGKAILSGSPLQGVQTSLDAIADPQGSGKNYFNNLASSTVPTLVKDVAVATDGLKRKATNPIEAVAGRIPGLRQLTPAKLGDNGEPLPRPNDAVGSILDPFKSSKSENSPEKNVATDQFFSTYRKASSDKRKANEEIKLILSRPNGMGQAERKAREYNESIESRFRRFNDKYGDTGLVEPGWEEQVDGLTISIKGLETRQKNIEKKK